jgi:hypothetical protein
MLEAFIPIAVMVLILGTVIAGLATWAEIQERRHRR